MEVNFKGVEKPVALDPETGEINTDFMNFIGYAPPKVKVETSGLTRIITPTTLDSSGSMRGRSVFSPREFHE